MYGKYEHEGEAQFEKEVSLNQIYVIYTLME